MTASTTHQTHPKTGRPIEPVPTFEVGDLVTEAFLGDGYPAVVVAATAKTVWVARVAFALGNVSADDQPGYNGYGDSATLVVDPESVEQALAAGKAQASKYVLRVSPHPHNGSLHEQEVYGGSHHSAKWAIPNSRAGSLQAGARYRQDPHR